MVFDGCGNIVPPPSVPHPLIGQKVKAWNDEDFKITGVLLSIIPEKYVTSKSEKYIVGYSEDDIYAWTWVGNIAPYPSQQTITATIEGDTIRHEGREFREVKG
jgi:hypothetical protein